MERGFLLNPTSTVSGLYFDRLDPEEFRMSVRLAVKAKNKDHLHELAAKTDTSRQPPVFAVMLASVASETDNRRVSMRPGAVTPTPSRSRWPLLFQVPWGTKQRGKWNAFGWCRTAVALRPQNALAHFYLSLAPMELDDQLGRLESLRRAIELAPQFAIAHAEMGHAFFALKRNEDALASFLRATEIDPDNVSGHAGLTMVYLYRKEWVLAATAWWCRCIVRIITSRRRLHDFVTR